jgi:hypothetical protein
MIGTKLSWEHDVEMPQSLVEVSTWDTGAAGATRTPGSKLVRALMTQVHQQVLELVHDQP